jgi:large subunit ribosomal protein L4
MPQPKTKDLVVQLRGLGLTTKLLILVDENQDNLTLAARNLPWVEVLDVRSINPVALIRFEKVLATTAAMKAVAERLQ